MKITPTPPFPPPSRGRDRRDTGRGTFSYELFYLIDGFAMIPLHGGRDAGQDDFPYDIARHGKNTWQLVLLFLRERRKDIFFHHCFAYRFAYAYPYPYKISAAD